MVSMEGEGGMKMRESLKGGKGLERVRKEG
jgi:hypothetical protein